ncbi:hypothetical protein BV22DRAFT_887966 [Leucogyrophana mollusca]|uniref:Uncharacterized protein n=1 Tax=Leucogyrophana mollusca TaxID=85980 RepID=A0ACB8AZD8_9AGAM|nr:hypothetical protein BV22DRAFT_887966 [Leucogyrophana mollusca]
MRSLLTKKIANKSKPGPRKQTHSCNPGTQIQIMVAPCQFPSRSRYQMPGDIASTERKIDPPPTVVGATGLPPSDNRPTSFYFVVEVDGKQGRTAELAPSPESTIEWDVHFPLQGIVHRASFVQVLAINAPGPLATG